MNQENNGQETNSAPSAASPAAPSNPAPRITESKLESAHADLPPLSVIGASSEPTVKPGSPTQPKQFGRRGTPAKSGFSGKSENSRPSIGVIENPSLATENISGELAKKPIAEAIPPQQPAPALSNQSPEGRESREPRRERFERPRREPREPRPERPRLQVEQVVIPVQAPIGFWANLKRKLASLFGIPDKAVFVAQSKGEQPRRGHRPPRRDFRGHRQSGGPSRDRGPRGRGDYRRDRGPRHQGPREG
ncbi:hypothetical protein EBR11_01840 [bacterium]|nr:hypothetical protein [bacterium]